MDPCETCGHEPGHDNDESGCACGCHYTTADHARIHAKLAVYRATGVYPSDAQLEEIR